MGRPNRKDATKRLVSVKAVYMEKNQNFLEFKIAKRVAHKMAKQIGVDSFPTEEETAVLIDKVIKLVDRASRQLDMVLDRPGGEYLRESLRKRRKVFGLGEVRGTELFDQTKKMLKRHAFKGPCPRCHGAKCGDCLGKGWVTFGMYREMMKEKSGDS